MNLNDVIGFGIAGNFAGHLEQAGEMKDFANIITEANKPKGIFPFYLPKAETVLSQYPYSSSEQIIPDHECPQLEPEVAIYCQVQYENNQVVGLKPTHFAAFNDCTLRKEGAKKISEKKNWGPASKGVSETWIALDQFNPEGNIHQYSLASFVERDGELHPYGIDAKISDYSLFNQELIEWLIDAMNHQDDNGPLENIPALLKAHDYPETCVISVGATAYAPFGEQNYLMPGDKLTVAVYETDSHDIQSLIREENFAGGISWLRQTVSL
ncbi:hypothetical protein VA7868_02823 [Vibrio aerogenes CECT 7868]|uniref:Fumarylacetoacetate (FAA) hydrolase family protein n=1 Tax=Vibrio aerogenes CECT 7868 TaxID=1216006 RepID=A0A1M5ZJW0_9VIBR|nr:DUF5718 family protein [Vibrio aerogenes]SHI24429.1 hypothetical protein VA7868_02823 [Vibrio aerogenes CECT 7868]